MARNKNVARKGKCSSALTEPLRIWARASTYHYSLVRPHNSCILAFSPEPLSHTLLIQLKDETGLAAHKLFRDFTTDLNCPKMISRKDKRCFMLIKIANIKQVVILDQ